MLVRVPPRLQAFFQIIRDLLDERDEAVTEKHSDGIQDGQGTTASWDGTSFSGTYVTDDGATLWEFSVVPAQVRVLARGELTEISVTETKAEEPDPLGARLDDLFGGHDDDEPEEEDEAPITPTAAAVGLVQSLVDEGLLELASDADIERLGTGLAGCLDRKVGRRGILAFLQASPDVEEHYLSDDDIEGLIERW
jgi:hypothetical protein